MWWGRALCVSSIWPSRVKIGEGGVILNTINLEWFPMASIIESPSRLPGKRRRRHGSRERRIRTIVSIRLFFQFSRLSRVSSPSPVLLTRWTRFRAPPGGDTRKFHGRAWVSCIFASGFPLKQHPRFPWWFPDMKRLVKSMERSQANR